MAKDVKKVGGNKDGGTATKEPKAPKRADFDLKTAVDAAGKAIPGRTDGKLQAVPSNWDPKQHKPLRQRDFAEKHVYMEYRADVMQATIQRQIDKIDKMRKEAKRLAEFGDADVRKRATKLMRARDLQAKLEKELADAGFDMSLLD